MQLLTRALGHASILTLLGGPALVAAAVAPGPGGVRLLSSDAAGVVLAVDVPTPAFSRVEALNGAFQYLSIDGYGGDGRAGEPLLPTTSFWLAVPEGATITLEASAEGERLYEGMRLLPQQELARVESTPGVGIPRAPQAAVVPEGTLAIALTLDAAAYARQGFGAAPVATLDGITYLRAQRVARVTLRPAAFDPASRRVRVWSRLRVRLNFAGGTTDPGVPASGSSPLSLEGAAPGDGFEAVYRGALLNYESGRAWRRDLAAGSLRRQGRQANAQAATAGGPGGLLGGPRQDFSSSPNWIKVTVAAKGVYRIDPVDLALAGASLGGLDPRTIRVFVKPGQPVLDERVGPAGWLSEVAISVVGESDGIFDPTDYVLFVGLGASGWKDEYGVPGSAPGWINHPYETRNTYWLTWGGGFVDPPHRWSSRSGAPELPAAFETPSYPARQHFESDFVYVPDLQEGGNYHAYVGTFWEKWAWLKINQSSGTLQLPADLPGAIESAPARLRARLWGNTRRITGPSGYFDHYTNVSFNDITFPERTSYGLTRLDFDSTFVGVREIGNRFSVFQRPIVIGNSPALQDEVALFWYELDYARRLQPKSNLLDFRSPDVVGAVGYGMGPFSSTTGFTLLDTSDPLAPVQITGVVERDTLGGKAIYFHDNVTSKRHYLALTAANVRRPDALQRVAIDDLAATTNGADYIVIAYDTFADPARALADFRATRLPGVANPRTRVVKISDIYAWYSGGRTDPTAIRNFLHAAIRQVGWSPAPSTVCLLGDASYDFKNILRVAPAGQPPSLLPAYVNGFQTRQFMTDDWLVDLDLGVREAFPGGGVPGQLDSSFYDLPDLMVGRLPASNLAEATLLVEGKVIPYEADPTWGEWRARGLLLADDIVQGVDGSGNPLPDPLSTEHMKEMEILSRAYLPPVVEQRKVYMERYPFGTGAEKPAVNRDVRAAVNEGVLFWDYIGHGNPFKMADENAFISSDVASLRNFTRPTFLVAASCDLGKFDHPVDVGLGEALLKSPSGGAIATFSASDIAFAFANASLAKEMFAGLFEETPEGFATPLGAAVLQAKLRPFGSSVNDLKYILMGDPAQTLAMPRHQVRMSLTDDDGGAPLDSLRRGRRVRVHGEVHASHDPNVSALLANYDGVASLLVTDAPPRDSVQGTFELLRYRYDPGTVFRGDIPVQGGRFEAVFVMPLEAIPGDGGKVRAYVSGGALDGGGAVVAGVAPGAPAVVDTTGPTIALAFTSGTLKVPPDATLRVLVRDENGVLLTGHTIPNSLYLTIDGVSRFDLTKDFRYDPGSYQQGVVEFRLPGLDPGPHSILVSAADNYAQGVLGRRNRSTASIDFEVVVSAAFTLGRAYNFPNPFAPDRGTTFVITGLNEPARVLIKIHTVSGSLVRVLAVDADAGQTQVFWDGADGLGDRVANGAYTYQVEAQGTTSGRVVRFRGQLAAVR